MLTSTRTFFARLRASAGRQMARLLLTLSLMARAIVGSLASLRRFGGHFARHAASETAPPTALPHRLTPAQRPDSLHIHAPRPQVVRNANVTHQQRQAAAGFNTRIAVMLTKRTGTMQTAYAFAGIGIGSLIGVFTGNVFLAALFGSISSYFLQLVLLPVLSVGQNVLSAHQEAQAEQQFAATMNTLHDSEQLAQHLDAQDAELVKQTRMLQEMLAAMMSAQNVALPIVAPESAPAPLATRPDPPPVVAVTTPQQPPRRTKRTLAAATQPKSSEASA